MSLHPCRFELIGSFFREQLEQSFGLSRVLVSFCGTLRASPRDNQLVNGIALRSGHKHVDAGSMQDHRGFGFADQKIQEPKWLGIRLERRQRLWCIGIGAFVRRQKIDAELALCLIARCLPFAMHVRDRAKRLVYLPENVQHGRCAVLDRNRRGFELRNIDVTGLERWIGKLGSQHRRIALIRDGADKDRTKPKYAGLGQGGNDIADLGSWTWQSK